MKDEKIGIKGMGFYLPEKKVSVKELGKKAGLPDIVIEYIGSEFVFEAEKNELPSDMAIKASKEALQNANISPSSIDLIINCPAGLQDYTLPPISGCIQAGIKALNATCFDVVQGCCGMMTGVQLAKNFILSGDYENILVVSSDKWSDFTNFHTADSVIFGDGAGAVIVSKNSDEFILKDFLYITKGEFFDLWGIEAGGLKFKCNNGENFIYTCLDKKRARGEFKDIYMPTFLEVAKKILNKNMLKPKDISYLNMVNANKKLLEIISEQLNISISNSCLNYLVKNGHIGGFDIFLNLYLAKEEGFVKSKDLILNLNAGIGFTWGACLIEA